MISQQELFTGLATIRLETSNQKEFFISYFLLPDKWLSPPFSEDGSENYLDALAKLTTLRRLQPPPVKYLKLNNIDPTRMFQLAPEEGVFLAGASKCYHK